MTTYQAHATFKFGDGRPGAAWPAANITAGLAGIKGLFTAFVLDSDIPALLRKGALETLQGRLDFARHTLTLGSNEKEWGGTLRPEQMSGVGLYVLSVADFPNPANSAPLFHWAPKTRETRLRDLMRNGGFRWAGGPLEPTRSVPNEFGPPQLFAACRATLRDAGNSEKTDPKKTIIGDAPRQRKLNAFWLTR